MPQGSSIDAGPGRGLFWGKELVRTATLFSGPTATKIANDSVALVRTLLRSYSEILFLNGTGIGAVMFLATLLHPQAALTGLLSVLTAYGCARLFGMGRQFLESGFYTYNPLLVGLGLGYSLQLSWMTAMFVVSASILTLVLTISLATMLRHYLALPVLSLPFVIASAAAYLATLRYSNLQIGSRPVSWLAQVDMSLALPLWQAGFFRSLGAILFLPYVLMGIVLAGLLVWQSRILFVLAVLGYYVGTGIRAGMLGSTSAAFHDLSGFNFELIAMAIGGVFLIPSARSYLIAMMAVGASSLLVDSMQVLWAAHGLPVYTLPFNLVTLTVLYSVVAVAYPGVAWQIGATPEETLDTELTRRNRFRGEYRTLHLPFFGAWTVWQGFDDIWTHKGAWRYAYDFVITDDAGRTHSDAGAELQDYYCYRKPVLSPVRGRVNHVVNDLPDNPIGQLDEDHNWGNHVVIQDERGFYAELSHFACGSIRVKEGDWVIPGTVLGHCGNSGYSPQPHIHVQAQLGMYPSGGTVPFSFVGYTDEQGYHANHVPTKSSVVQPATIDPQLDALTDFCLNEWFDYELSRAGRTVGSARLDVRMAADGTFYFESSRGGKLYFGKQEGTFYFYRLEGSDEILRMLFEAVPRLPLTHADGLVWRDVLPISVALRGATRVLAMSCASLWPAIARVDAVMTYRRRGLIETEIASATLGLRRSCQAEFGQSKGLAVVRSGEYTLRRVAHGTD